MRSHPTNPLLVARHCLTALIYRIALTISKFLPTVNCQTVFGALTKKDPRVKRSRFDTRVASMTAYSTSLLSPLIFGKSQTLAFDCGSAVSRRPLHAKTNRL